MAANLREMMKAHLNTVFLNTNHFADLVTFKPRGSETSKSIKVEITHLEDVEAGMQGNKMRRLQRRLLRLETDATRGVASPAEGDVFTLPDGKEWKVRGRPRQGASGLQELEVVRIEVREVSYDDYRMGL